MYNKLLKTPYAELHLKGAFTCNAKRYKKSQNLIRRNTPHPLRWDVPNSMVLQKTQPQVVTAKLCTFFSAQQPLYNRRTNFSSTPYYNSWSWTPEFHKDITIQRFVSSNNRLENFSQCYYSATFSSAAYSPETKTNTFGSRPPSPEDILLSQGTYQCNTGFRYYDPNCIWQIGRSSQRLQSIQAGTVILSSSTLLRGSHSRLPTREVSSRRRTHRVREETVHRRSFSQVTSPYIQDKGSWRLQVVRSRNSSSSRRKEDRLCHRSQSQPTYPASSWRASLSRVQKRLGGSRISVSTPQIQASPLYRSTKTYPREGQRSTYSLYSQEVRLSCDSHKSKASSGKCLEVLLRPSQNRAKYQRTKVGLLSFQDTHKELFGKQGILSSSFIRLQYRKLVQKVMFARAISICYVTNYSQRAFGVTRQISKIWPQKPASIAKTLCLQLGV